MRPSTRLLQHACRITLFTRENCGLCTQARSVLSNVWDTRHFEYTEIDIIKSESKSRWRDLYEFDTPVVSLVDCVLSSVPAQGNFAAWVVEVEALLTRSRQIHVAKASNPEEHPQAASQAIKLMHRFTEDEVKAKMDAAEQS